MTLAVLKNTGQLLCRLSSTWLFGWLVMMRFRPCVLAGMAQKSVLHWGVNFGPCLRQCPSSSSHVEMLLFPCAIFSWNLKEAAKVVIIFNILTSSTWDSSASTSSPAPGTVDLFHSSCSCGCSAESLQAPPAFTWRLVCLSRASWIFAYHLLRDTCSSFWGAFLMLIIMGTSYFFKIHVLKIFNPSLWLKCHTLIIMCFMRRKLSFLWNTLYDFFPLWLVLFESCL